MGMYQYLPPAVFVTRVEQNSICIEQKQKQHLVDFFYFYFFYYILHNLSKKLYIEPFVPVLFHQGARCGEGLRFRNVSCFVSDGSSQQDGSLVDDELCGDQEPSVDGDTNIILQESCTVPCPGKKLQQGDRVDPHLCSCIHKMCLNIKCQNQTLLL